jgi:hypothetical protein
MRTKLITLVMILLFMFSRELWAHARLLPAGSLPPRSTSPGIKTGPCGGLPRSATPTVLVMGSDIQVQWEETFNHPGRFEIYFSPAGETGWTLLKTVPDDKNLSTDLPHAFSTTVTLPNVQCTDCVIQLIQVMTENPAFPSLYYSCADIVLQSTPNPNPNPNPIPDPNPNPIPEPTNGDCH